MPTTSEVRRSLGANSGMKEPFVINRVRLAKAELAAIPGPERGLLFMMGHIANELMALSRLLQFAITYDADGSVRSKVHSSQAVLLAKMFAGKCKEAWEFVRVAVLGSKLGREIVNELDEEIEIKRAPREALEALKKYFGKATIIDRLRNEFAFHYPTKGWETRFDLAFEAIDEDDCEYYLSDVSINTFWYMAEAVVTLGMIDATADENVSGKLDEMIRESIDVASWLSDLCDYCIGAGLLKYVGLRPIRECEKVELRGVPIRNDVDLPVFVRIPELDY